MVFHSSSFAYKELFPAAAAAPAAHYVTDLGALFASDCLDVMRRMSDHTVDTLFADPPFNLRKAYAPGLEKADDLPEQEYLDWCYEWIKEGVRLLKPGGSFFLYNLPKWNMPLGAYMQNSGLLFRHWIAISAGNTLPIPNRLYPAHYSLLYFTKGKPNTFRRIRTPIETCRHCGGEIRDYGGHRHAMNPNGVNLKDVWTDIPPVRHRKFKSKARRANALSTKLLDRVVEMSTREGDLILDPFGGSGTTFAVCEEKGRNWIGVELNFADGIVERLRDGGIQPHRNDDHVEG